VRALLGGWNAWLQAGGETEPIDANTVAPGGGSNNKNDKNDKNDKPPASAPTNQSGAQVQQVASPNPTIKELDGGSAATSIQPGAVRKTTPTKPKRKTRRRTRGA